MNKSNTYLLPLISELVNIEFIEDLKEVYVQDDLDCHNNCIYLLYKFNSRNPKYTTFENDITKNELFVDLIDINSDVLYILKFPEDYIEEYNLFKEGSYSKFGDDAKELILKFWNNKYNSSKWIIKFLIETKQILYRDPKLRSKLEAELSGENSPIIISDDAELSDKCDIDKETVSLNSCINNRHGKHTDINDQW